VIRGGSWNNNPRNDRSANRNRNEPGNRNNNLGFRLARAQQKWWIPRQTEPAAFRSRPAERRAKLVRGPPGAGSACERSGRPHFRLAQLGMRLRTLANDEGDPWQGTFDREIIHRGREVGAKWSEVMRGAGIFRDGGRNQPTNRSLGVGERSSVPVRTCLCRRMGFRGSGRE
jgi:hypothetical protein